jgi:hypothetical protein
VSRIKRRVYVNVRFKSPECRSCGQGKGVAAQLQKSEMIRLISPEVLSTNILH